MSFSRAASLLPHMCGATNGWPGPLPRAPGAAKSGQPVAIDDRLQAYSIKYNNIRIKENAAPKVVKQHASAPPDPITDDAHLDLNARMKILGICFPSVDDLQ